MEPGANVSASFSQRQFLASYRFLQRHQVNMLLTRTFNDGMILRFLIVCNLHEKFDYSVPLLGN